MKKTFDLSQIEAGGELAYRIHKEQARLETHPYTPQDCLAKEKEIDWPGDWIGRAILGNAMIARASHSRSAYLEELLDTAFSLQNEKGYLGAILPEGLADEQQFSGHNWLLRGLLTCYEESGREDLLSFAASIVKNLYLPAASYYASYPVSREERVFSGGKSGTKTDKTVGHWITSTDTGCAFMCLDGLSEYYALTKDPAVSSMLDQMIEKFMTIDFVGLEMQTHASLSACRGILRFCQNTGKKELLDFVCRFADLYRDYGMTASYANYNWFCRPTWTEPCAVVDSYMLFYTLFLLTGSRTHLSTAFRIYYNALCFGQRANGGFGTDTCVDADEPVLHPHGTPGHLNEAFWCCSMRGGEGLARVSESSFAWDEDGSLYVTCVDSAVLRTEHFSACATLSLGRTNRLTLSLRQDAECPIRRVLLPLPDGFHDAICTVNGKEADLPIEDGFAVLPFHETETEIALTYGLSFVTEPTAVKFRTKQGVVCRLGDRLVGIPEEEGMDCGVPAFVFEDDTHILDQRSGRSGDFPGKNVDALRETGLYSQVLRLVFAKE